MTRKEIYDAIIYNIVFLNNCNIYNSKSYDEFIHFYSNIEKYIKMLREERYIRYNLIMKIYYNIVSNFFKFKKTYHKVYYDELKNNISTLLYLICEEKFISEGNVNLLK